MKIEKDVLAFHKLVGASVGDPSNPGFRDENLRARLIGEEAIETVYAILGSEDGYSLIFELAQALLLKHRAAGTTEPDFVEAIDGCCDSIYVCTGSLIAWGVPVEIPWDLVQNANMTKGGGPKDVHGKALKPPGWISPNDAIRTYLDGKTRDTARPRD